MAILYKLQCPDCSEKFETRVEKGEGLPNFCPHCGVYVGADPNFVPSQLNIITNKGKTVDKTYREVEESSKYRAEITGDPSLKITDMKDNLREGDVAAPSVNNTVSKTMEAMQSELGYTPWQNVGQVPGAGAPAPKDQTGARALEVIAQPFRRSNGTGGVAPMAHVAGVKAGFGGAG